MYMVMFIIGIIITIGLIFIALLNNLPMWSILAAASCLVLSIIAFTGSINTNIAIDKNITTIDANTTLETYNYNLINYDTEPYMVFIAWGSLVMFFIVIINLVIKWNEVEI